MSRIIESKKCLVIVLLTLTSSLASACGGEEPKEGKNNISADVTDTSARDTTADDRDALIGQDETSEKHDAAEDDVTDSEDGTADEGSTTEPEDLVKPNASNTGPRIPLTRTLTPAQALAELRETKRLSGVKIVGRLKLSGSDGVGWVIEDSRIEADGGHYALHGYSSLENFTGTRDDRPIFRYVEIVGSAATGTGRSSASVYGKNMILEHADIYGSDDGIKASSNLDVLYSWIHDNDHPSGAHCDGIQIRSGTGILIKGSRIDAYVGYSSDQSTPLGDTCSGGLQTGSVTRPIEAHWESNWFAGGHYTIRGSSDPTVSYTFRNNRWMPFGTSVVLGRTDLPPNRYGPVTSDLGDFDDSNIWEHTGDPVR